MKIIFKAALMHHLLAFPWLVLLLCQIQIWFNKQQLKKSHLWNILTMLRKRFNWKASWRLSWTRRTISYAVLILPQNKSLYFSCPFTFLCKAWPISFTLFSYRNNPLLYLCFTYIKCLTKHNCQIQWPLPL